MVIASEVSDELDEIRDLSPFSVVLYALVAMKLHPHVPDEIARRRREADAAMRAKAQAAKTSAGKGGGCPAT